MSRSLDPRGSSTVIANQQLTSCMTWAWYQAGWISQRLLFLELRRGNASVGMLQGKLPIVNIPCCMMGSEFSLDAVL